MHDSASLLLSGRIVLPDGGARQRYVFVSDGVIRWVSRSRPPAALIEGVREVGAGPQDWIFPGLLDLHTHAWYNLLPLWSSERAPFDNRHVWRGDPEYRLEIGGVLKKLHGHIRARKVFSELQAVAGGTTLLDEPRPLESEAGSGPTILCRDSGSPTDLGLDPQRAVRSVVDFFKPHSKGEPAPAPGRNGKPSLLKLTSRTVRNSKRCWFILLRGGADSARTVASTVFEGRVRSLDGAPGYARHRSGPRFAPLTRTRLRHRCPRQTTHRLSHQTGYLDRLVARFEHAALR